MSIVETVRHPLLILDAELRVRMANRAFYEMFQVAPAETERQLIYTLGNGQWNIPRLRELLEDILPHDSPFDDFYVVHNFPVLGRRSMLLNARRVRVDGTLPPHILLAIEDITDRLHAAATLREISDHKLIEKEVLESVADEQRRIGQDLHDGTGQELTGLGFLAQELAESLSHPKRQRGRTLPKAPSSESSEASALADASDDLAATARKIVEGLDRALKQVRQVSKGLIPVDISAEGLMVALGDLADNVTSQSKVKCRFSGPVPIHDNQTATHLYRIAQEAITNALKHSRANHITVCLAAHDDGGVTLSIRDDGVGLTDQADATPGMGLKIMRYRASLIGATLHVESAEDGGSLVTCTVGKEQT